MTDKEDCKGTSDWTFTTFEKYMDHRFRSSAEAVSAALIAADKAVEKAETAQRLRNEQQNEFRQSLSDLSKLMWTIKEGTAAVDGLRREREQVQSAFERRVIIIENGFANIQGRMWAVSAIWAIVVLGASIAVRFM